MIVKRPRILGGFLAQNPEFDSFSIDLIKEMLKSDVEKLSKANVEVLHCRSIVVVHLEYMYPFRFGHKLAIFL